jgi:hypothetical protein
MGDISFAFEQRRGFNLLNNYRQEGDCMARTVSELRIFVASPDDVKEERDLLEDVISKFNIDRGKTEEIRLDLVRWETHCFPGINTDVQANVNDQISDNYDIFIGIMWKKFGTPTPRAGSGTAEEFERAYQRYKQDPDNLRVMFYFKDASPPSMSEIDPEQWAQVSEFRRQLGEKGVLYWSFNDQRDFESLIQIHLNRQAQEWGKSWGARKEIDLVPSPSEDVTCNTTEIDDEEDGFWDLLELGQDSFDESTEIVVRISDAITTLGYKVETRGKELNQAVKPMGTDPKMAKRIYDRTADDLETFVARMNIEIPLFSKSFSMGINAIGRAATIYTDINDASVEELISVQETTQTLRTGIMQSMDAITSFKDTIDATPRITKTFNRAKRHTVDVLGHLIKEMTSSTTLTLEVEKAIVKAIEDLNQREPSPKNS